MATVSASMQGRGGQSGSLFLLLALVAVCLPPRTCASTCREIQPGRRRGPAPPAAGQQTRPAPPSAVQTASPEAYLLDKLVEHLTTGVTKSKKGSNFLLYQFAPTISPVQ
ncbi:unnamed protein product [Urochloa humidicola]